MMQDNAIKMHYNTKQHNTRQAKTNINGDIRQDKATTARQDDTLQDKPRQGKPRQHKTNKDKVIQYKARQDKTIHAKTIQGKTT